MRNTDTPSSSHYVLLYSKRAGECVKDQTKKGADRKHTIFGFKTYCALLRIIWNKSHADDPYADIALCEIDRRINHSLEIFDRTYRALDSKLNAAVTNRLESALACSNGGRRHFTGESLKHPVRIDLSSTIPYVHLGGALLSVYDDIARKIAVCGSLKFTTGADAHHWHKHCRTAIRSVFSAPVMYKDTGIARDDIVHGSVEGLSAIERCGPIPNAVLTRKLSPQFIPK